MNKRYKQRYGKQFKKKQLWDLHTYLAKTILINLRAFRDLHLNSIPPILDESDASIPNILEMHRMIDDKEDPQIQKWKSIIDKMIYSFNEIAYGYPNNPQTILIDEYESYIRKLRIKNEYPDSFKDHMTKYTMEFMEKYPHGEEPRATKEQYKEYNDKIEEGLRLFVKYFRELWD